MRITVACPEALIPDANHLAMVLAEGPPDAMTYRNPSWQDADGNLYAAASFVAQPSWVDAAQGPLERPEWDTDYTVNMAAANRAQAKVSIWGLGENEDSPVLDTEHIFALFHPDPHYALELAGIGPIQPIENEGA